MSGWSFVAASIYSATGSERKPTEVHMERAALEFPVGATTSGIRRGPRMRSDSEVWDEYALSGDNPFWDWSSYIAGTRGGSFSITTRL
jgi:hypothetical protein